MEYAEVLGMSIEVIVWIAVFVLFCFFVYWTAKFLNTVPHYLERIATALEKIASKK
jgi:hypothetical protein